MKNLIFLVYFCTFFLVINSVHKNKTNFVRKHIKRLKKVDGGLKLVGGRSEFEGNVEILYHGKWGAVCDDEWDIPEAEVVCRQLFGYKTVNSSNKPKPTSNSYFGKAKRRFLMDNVYCNGTEAELLNCRFEGWGKSDCNDSEAAGVVCYEEPEKNALERPKIAKKVEIKLKNIRLNGGRISTEGRVEIQDFNGDFAPICAEGWSLKEALVVCKTLNLGFASAAIQTTLFGGNFTKSSLAGVKCFSNETSFAECTHETSLTGKCEEPEVAAVSCTNSLSDLVIDHQELTNSAYLQDLPMFFMQCAMEENCAASSAYKVQKENDAWHLETRRLLRFTARILNAGTEDFRPIIPKSLWEWHMCHLHYHSMEIFAAFDIFDTISGKKVAEGHKASFCLEDNQCLEEVKPKYSCANYGDQGISVNCSDIYKRTVDCQWVDISDLRPGNYKIKIAVNPEYKIAEMDYGNNAAICDFIYTPTQGRINNCNLGFP